MPQRHAAGAGRQTQPHQHLPRLPPISVTQHHWDGDYSTLAFYLRRFCEQFEGYGDAGALSFLRMCIPAHHLKDIEAATTLDEVLGQLGEWCSDAKIHTERIELELHNMPQCTSLEHDRSTLK